MRRALITKQLSDTRRVSGSYQVSFKVFVTFGPLSIAVFYATSTVISPLGVAGHDAAESVSKIAVVSLSIRR